MCPALHQELGIQGSKGIYESPLFGVYIFMAKTGFPPTPEIRLSVMIAKGSTKILPDKKFLTTLPAYF